MLLPWKLNPPYAFGISNCVKPPYHQNSGPRNPPLPQNSKMPPVEGYGYSLESHIGLNFRQQK